MQVVSFVDYTPPRRYDEVPWTQARIEEAEDDSGPWTVLEIKALDPVDTDPENPASRSFTTALASDEMGLYYRLVFLDDDGAQTPTLPEINEPDELLAVTALCTDEDVRAYLGIKPGELSAEDNNTIIRLVNAASETFTDESQRLWRHDPANDGLARLYRFDDFDLTAGRLRIDDAATVLSVAHGTYASGTFTTLSSGYYAWIEEPGFPVSALVFADVTGYYAGDVISVEANWGWPVVPEKVRQAVIYTAAEWYARDVEKFSSVFSLDQAAILLPQVLPRQVQAMAESYRRWRVA